MSLISTTLSGARNVSGLFPRELAFRRIEDKIAAIALCVFAACASVFVSTLAFTACILLTATVSFVPIVNHRRTEELILMGYSYSGNVLRISLPYVSRFPKEIATLLTTNGLPRLVLLHESPRTIDAGGVKKQFFATLIKAFCSTLSKNERTGVPQIASMDGEEMRGLYTLLGKLYRLLLTQKSAKPDQVLVAGDVLPEGYFRLLETLSEETDGEALARFAPLLSSIDTSLKEPALVVHNRGNRAISSRFAAHFGIPSSDAYAVAREYIIPYVDAASAFLRGGGELLKDALSRQGADALERVLQGEPLSSYRMIESIDFSGSRTHPHASFLTEKILFSSKEWRREFLRAVTGNRTLPAGSRISVRVDERGSVFHFHTCFNRVTLPGVPLEKEAFFSFLDASICGEHFNVG